jgi:hypothetical protein
MVRYSVQRQLFTISIPRAVNEIHNGYRVSMVLCQLHTEAEETVLGAFAMLRKATISFAHVCLSVRPHGTTRLPIFMKFENFLKTCREKSSFIKIWQVQRVLYMNTDIHLWSYLDQFFLEMKMFQKHSADIIEKHTICSITFFSKIVPFSRQCGKIVLSRTGHKDNTADEQRMLNT